MIDPSHSTLPPPLPPRKGVSQIATQQTSQGTLLAQIQARPEHQSSWFILKSFEAYFIKSSVKEKFIKEVRNQFCRQAHAQKLGAFAAYLLFIKVFNPMLEKYDLESLSDWEPLLTTPEGVRFCMTHLEAPLFKKQPLLIKAFGTLPLVKQLIGTLSWQGQEEYLKAWIQNAKEMEAEDFKNFLSLYTDHLKYAEHLQSLRPKVFDQSSEEQTKLVLGFESFYVTPAFQKPANRLVPFDKALCGQTAVDNRQMVQASVGVFYLGITDKGFLRTSPVFRQRTSQYGVYNQIGIPLVLNGPDEQILNNLPLPELYLTHPATMETRAIRLPLPIRFPISVGEAKKLLELLTIYIGSPRDSEEEIAKLGISEEERNALRAAFLEYNTDLGQAFGSALGDFNSTPTRPKETTARSQPANAALIQNPRSPAAAIRAAKLRNLFLLKDGTLSLLPSGPGENHRRIGTLQPDEYRAATAVFSGKYQGELAIEVPETLSDQTLIKKAHLAITLRPEELGVNYKQPCLVMETTITLNGKSTTRKSYYALDIKGKTVEEIKKDIVSSGLLRRDLLLAKSAFIEEHVI